MAIKNFSYERGKASAASEKLESLLKEQWKDFSPVLILFFVSETFGMDNPSAPIKAAFPDARIIGLTSRGEFYNGEYLSSGICVMGFDEESVSDVCVELVSAQMDRKAMRELLRGMHKQFGGYDEILNEYSKYVGLVVFDGVCGCEERFMDGLGMVTDVRFLGGTSSAEDIETACVYCDGTEYHDSIILAILKTVHGYEAFKMQSADLACEQAYTVTKADLGQRILYELDGRPACEVYAEAVGVSAKEAESRFYINSFGVLSGKELFIRTPKAVVGSAISLYCGIPEGARIYILKTGDIINDTKKDLKEFITANPAGVVQFNCCHRTFQLLDDDIIRPYCGLFSGYKSIGGSTNGEAYLGFINKTSVILAIK